MSSLAVQKAILALVKASTAVKAVTADPVPIYEYVPETVPPLYLIYQEMSLNEMNTNTDIGGVHNVRISTYSYYEGSLKVKQVNEALRKLFDYQPLTLDNSVAVLMYVTSMYMVQSADKTYVGVLDLQVLTEQWS